MTVSTIVDSIELKFHLDDLETFNEDFRLLEVNKGENGLDEYSKYYHILMILLLRILHCINWLLLTYHLKYFT